MIAATGFRPDLALLGELRLDLDDRVEAARALAPLIDPNLHSCGSVPPHGVDELSHPDAGVYMVGMKSYGRAPTFLLRTGYEQARSVVAALAGDWEAAQKRRVRAAGDRRVQPRGRAGRRRRGRGRSAELRVLRLSTDPQVPGPAWRTRAWAIVGALSITETVSWGILYYAFAAFLVPMQRELDASAAQLTGAFSLALAVSALAGVFVGRHLDRHSPRTLMTAGSIAGAGLVVAWSQVDGLVAFYALWFAIGLVMAAVLYEPAFTVLAKHFHDAPERRRAMTAMTLVAALASFIFLPLSQALIDAYGWRDALLVLAVVLAVVTVPLHGLVLRPAAAPTREPAAVGAGGSGAALVAVLAAVGRVRARGAGHDRDDGVRDPVPARARSLAGLRGLRGGIDRGLADPRTRPVRAPGTPSRGNVFALIGLGVAVVVAFDSTAAVLIGLVLLGMGNGMATLSRATAIADLYGAAAYGTIASVAGGVNTAARAAGPFLAAVYATVVGYTGLLWTLVALAAVAALLARLVRNDDVAGLRSA